MDEEELLKDEEYIEWLIDAVECQEDVEQDEEVVLLDEMGF